MDAWPEPVERVAAALRAAAVDARLEEFPAGTPTAAAAAEAVGCELSQIVKSLVFVCDGRPVLALVPGDRRADPGKVAAAAGAARRAGRAPGGGASPPRASSRARSPRSRPGRSSAFSSSTGCSMHELVWVGAGTSRHMAGLAPLDLVRVAKAEPADLIP